MPKQMIINIPTSGDSSNRAQTKTVTINNLKTVDSISVNTGTVGYTKTGNDVQINVDNGVKVRTDSFTPSTTGIDNRQTTAGGDPATLPATVPYNDGTYTGTLSKNGAYYVTSGSYTPSDSFTATDTRTTSAGGDPATLPTTVPYNNAGYTGNLPKNGAATVQSGSYTPSDSRTETSSITGTSSSSGGYASSVPYNSGGYSGTLTQSGSPVFSHSTTSGGGSFTATDSRAGTGTWRWSHDGDAWRSDGMVSHNLPASVPYNSGGYTGTLNRTSISGGPPSEPAPFTGSIGQTKTATASISGSYSGTVTNPGTTTNYYTQNYSGTVTKPAVDTRVWLQNYSGTVTKAAVDTRIWRQDYSGTVYGTTVNTDMYAYVVTLDYTDTVQIGTIKAKSGTVVITLPVYDLTMTNPIVRVKVSSGIGCFELLPIGDSRASPFRVQTHKGLFAIAKL